MEMLERLTKNIQTKAWGADKDFFPVANKYTVGIAGQNFFEELKQNGKIVGTKCDTCNLTYVPAMMYCPKCFEQLKDFIDVGTRGSLYSFTIVHIGKDGARLEKPVIIGVIKIKDGSLIHKVEGVSEDQIKIGMELEAVLKPKEQRKGSINDIEYFKPI